MIDGRFAKKFVYVSVVSIYHKCVCALLCEETIGEREKDVWRQRRRKKRAQASGWYSSLPTRAENNWNYYRYKKPSKSSALLRARVGWALKGVRKECWGWREKGSTRTWTMVLHLIVSIWPLSCSSILQASETRDVFTAFSCSYVEKKKKRTQQKFRGRSSDYVSRWMMTSSRPVNRCAPPHHWHGWRQIEATLGYVSSRMAAFLVARVRNVTFEQLHFFRLHYVAALDLTS